MDFNYQSVQRLGFDSYCSNLAVNLIENQEFKHGYKFENEIYSCSVTQSGKEKVFYVRAYVKNCGWKSTELIFTNE